MKVHVTFRAVEISTTNGGKSIHRIVPGMSMTHPAEWAHVRDGSIRYRNPLDPPGRTQGIPLAHLFAYAIDEAPETPGGANGRAGSPGGPSIAESSPA